MRFPTGTNLRLVGGADGGSEAGPLRRARSDGMGRGDEGLVAEAVVARRVAAENRQAATTAAGLSEVDARWVLAARASEAMGPRGLIGPEERDRLLRVAHRMGLRAFDASLVLAIVQDAARRGENPLGRSSADRLAHVGAARGREGLKPIGWQAIAVFVLATVGFWMLVYWVTGAG